MALATSSLVDGEWVTRSLDVNTVLRHYDQQDRDAATTPVEVETAPKLGLLTQTVIRSPLAHWILPIRLRDDRTHDVAFIGVRNIFPSVSSSYALLFFLFAGLHTSYAFFLARFYLYL